MKCGRMMGGPTPIPFNVYWHKGSMGLGWHEASMAIGDSDPHGTSLCHMVVVLSCILEYLWQCLQLRTKSPTIACTLGVTNNASLVAT